jgi:hypothetical protein
MGKPDITSKAAFEKNAQETVADLGFGWNLGNTLDSYGSSVIGSGSLATETSWGNPKTTKAMIDTLKEEGVTSIRVPVTWYNHMDSDYNIDENWMARVREIIDYVIDDDLYCIINVHHDTGEKGWLKASSENLDTKIEMFTAIWQQIADEFKDYGDKLLFEGFNEILNDSSEWVNPDDEAVEITNQLNQIFVDTVRASGGNNDKRNLICNTYCAGANSAVTKNFVLPTDTIENRLIVEVHVYQPYYFTSEFYPNVTTWTKSEINTYISNVYNQFVQNGIPVIVGEFGCVDKDNAEERLAWAKYYVDLCTEYGIKCFWWDDGGNYKIFNRKSLKWIYPDLFKTMLAASKGEEYIPEQDLLGDTDGDGELTVADVTALQNYLLKSSVYSDSIANADMNSDEKINVIDLAILKNTLSELDNVNYCEDVANWTTWIDESAGGGAEVEYTENGISLNVTDAGTYTWNVQASYIGLTFEKGTTYQISFDAVTSDDVSVTYNAMQNHDSYVPYFSQTISLSETTKHITATFTMTKDTDKNCSIAFNLGVDKVLPYTITIENLSLTKVK